MTDLVHVPFGEDRSATAVLLLDAAENTEGYEQNVVVVDHFTNSYVVPAEVAKTAGIDTFDPDADFVAQVEEHRKSADDPDVLNVNGLDVAGEGFADPGPAVVTDPEATPAEAPVAPAKKAVAKKAPAKKTAAKKS